ncbi:MAG: hypothetical protein R3A13_01870 [Bdellovibrionota bacterium]
MLKIWVATLVGSSTPAVTITRNPVINSTTYNGAIQVEINYTVPLIVPARLMGSANGDFVVKAKSIMQ